LFTFKIGRHLGVNIKSEYDEVMKFFDINSKVFKVVADQAANMKKAFSNEYEASDKTDELQILINDLLLNQKREDMKKREAILRDDLEREIREFNESENESFDCAEQTSHNNKMVNRELAQLMNDESIDDINESSTDLDTSRESINDDDQSNNLQPSVEQLIEEFITDDHISTYL